ncbi:MAG: RsmB/NOP family class I SAM-dependent RNA methyltransferase [Clostridia bacterium]|nr:RsmB/NOP family class I SAM-dependent RNA methyltransferase [Clostridia bacterium]
MIPLPEEFQENMQRLLGDECSAFLRALEDPPALALRLNPKRTAAEAAALPFTEAAVPWAALGRYLRSGEDVKPGSSVAHAAGAFYIQEASAMASAAVLDARPGERVLDLCAAPGGKSTQIAAAMADSGLLVSNDPEPQRARALAGNLERMGAMNAVVTSALPEQLSARWPADFFDAILVDAPCSGEGMFRRDPESRAEWKPASPEGCARRQAGILDHAAKLLRPGGRLVYSTCTFNDLENEGSVLGFLARHPDFHPEDFELPGVGASARGMLRLLPHRVRGDGHFVARLRREAGESSAKPLDAPVPKADREAVRLLEALAREVCALPEALSGMTPFIQGDRLYCAPRSTPPLTGLRVTAPGLCLLKIGRNHLEPDHALAMALPPECAYRRAELDDHQARAWLRGEAVELEGEKGWTLALYRGMPLGWGKRSGTTLKNHLPKGLRRQNYL